MSIEGAGMSLEPLSRQTIEWCCFSGDVRRHIENYCIPQWGDSPDDQVSQYDVATMKANLMRYVGRIGQGQRGKKEALRDCLKIAHYACRLRTLLENSDD